MKQFNTFLLLGLLVCICGVIHADLVHRYDFAVDPNDRVGTANLTLGGGAVIADGVLDLPGGETRVNNAHAAGAALTELAATINGAEAITMEAWFNQDGLNNWRKVMMAGASTSMYMDMTPRRGDGTEASSCSLRTGGGELNVPNGNVLAVDTEYYMAAIWDEAANLMTIVVAEAGNPASAVVASGTMGGFDLANLSIDQFYLGSAVGWPDPDFDGQIAEFRIYNEALSAETIAKNIELGPEDTAAVLVSPEDGKAQVGVDENLKWQASMISSKPVVNFDVYLGTDETAVANATKSDAEYEATVAVAGGIEEYEPGTLTPNLDYYWRIDQVIDDGVTDPNTVKGAVWHFDTKTIPFFSGQPADVTVAEGDDASFSVTVESATATTFEWFKNGVVAALVDDADYDIVSDTLTSTLTILAAEVADANDYYCIATNTAGPQTSNSATLSVLRMVAHYDLETVPTPTVPDITGSGNDGTAVGDPNLVAGIIGSGAYKFYGDDHIDIPRSVQDDFTISAWVKTTQTISNTDSGWWTGAGIVNGEMPGGVYDFGLQLLGTKACIAVQNAQGSSETDINDDVWHHLVFTRVSTDGAVRLYVDGETEVAGNSVTGPLTVPTGLTIGKQLTGSGYFIGQIDDVRIYEYVLEPLDVAEMFVAGKPGETACVEAPEFDFNGDCVTNLGDLMYIASEWLDCGLIPQTACQ